MARQPLRESWVCEVYFRRNGALDRILNVSFLFFFCSLLCFLDCRGRGFQVENTRTGFGNCATQDWRKYRRKRRRRCSLGSWVRILSAYLLRLMLFFLFAFCFIVRFHSCGSVSMEDMLSGIKSIPELLARKKSLVMHTHIATSILGSIKQRDLHTIHLMENGLMHSRLPVCKFCLLCGLFCAHLKSSASPSCCMQSRNGATF